MNSRPNYDDDINIYSLASVTLASVRMIDRIKCISICLSDCPMSSRAWSTLFDWLRVVNSTDINSKGKFRVSLAAEYGTV